MNRRLLNYFLAALLIGQGVFRLAASETDNEPGIVSFAESNFFSLMYTFLGFYYLAQGLERPRLAVVFAGVAVLFMLVLIANSVLLFPAEARPFMAAMLLIMTIGGLALFFFFRGIEPKK